MESKWCNQVLSATPLVLVHLRFFLPFVSQRVESNKLFQWGTSALCSGFVILNVRRLDELWEAVPSLDLKRIGKRMRSAPDDQLILRAMNRTYPEVVGVLPREWDITANNGYQGKFNKKFLLATDEKKVLDELKYAGILHLNGGGTSDEAYFMQHQLLTGKYDHSFGLLQYYARMPWSWAKFIVESNKHDGISYSPVVVTEPHVAAETN